MNAVLLFVVVVILPNGQPQVNATAVSQCPDQKVIHDTYEQAQIAGYIIDWRATCFPSGLVLPTRK